MGRGGARIGSGRKPKPTREFNVIDGGASFDSAGLDLPPDDLTAEEQRFWRQYAPLALERRTLVPATVPGFRLLCRTEATLTRMAADLLRDGDTVMKVTIDGSGQEHQEVKNHPKATRHDRLIKVLDGLLKSFCLTPFGKPLTVAPPKTKAEQDKAKSRQAFFGVARG